jgi:hypothetical protein
VLRITRRGWLVVAAGVVAAALMVDSAAYACSYFRGTMTVTGGGGTTTVVGSGKGMTYCRGYPKDSAAAPAGGAHGTSGSSITITVAPSSGCSDAALGPDTYDVNFIQGKAYTYTVDATTHKRTYAARRALSCIVRGNGVSALTPGSLIVPVGGTASGTFKLPTNLTKSGPSDAAAVCVVDSFGDSALQAPVIIT